MNQERVEQLLEACKSAGGNYSVIYPLIKHRLEGYTERELFGAEEFLFFEERYLKALKHMFDNNIHGHILDIGCQFGFQSELFLDEESYTGIDVWKYRFFNQDHPKVTYQVGSFPNQLRFDLSKYIVFSSMSLGYFPLRDENGEIVLNVDDPGYLETLVDVLKACNHLYIATTEELLNRLKQVFHRYELIDESVIPGNRFIKPSRFDMYYFSNI